MDTINSERVIIKPFTGNVSGQCLVPGSKSITNRAIILAISADGTSVIRNPLLSDDTQAGLKAAEALGCHVVQTPEYIEIKGIGRQRPVSDIDINVRSAGTVARFLPCILAMGDEGYWRLAASEQMTARPMTGLFEALAGLGPCLEPLGHSGHYPLGIRGGVLTEQEAYVRGDVSSQYLSGLLLGAPLTKNELTIKTNGQIVQRQYVDITVDCMRAFGAALDVADDYQSIKIAPNGYKSTDFAVEADASTATYFSALPAAVGGTITLTNLSQNSRQPDIRFLEILEQLGCQVSWSDRTHVQVKRPTSLKKLKGGQTFDLNDCSDAALTVAALAPLADGPITIKGIEHIRNHECDRISAMSEALSKMSVRVVERTDGWTITPGAAQFAQVQTRDDHRMAMALTLLGFAANGVSLDHPGCVAKTCPEYFSMMEELGGSISYETSN